MRCARSAGRLDTIASLVRRGLLVEPDPSAAGWFRIIGLARRVLHDHLPLYDWERVDIQRRAASWLEPAGHHLDALRCLVSAHAAAAIAGFLRDHGAALLPGGATDALLDAFGHVPDEVRNVTLDVLRGEAHAGPGDWDAALASFERVAPPEGTLPAGLAWRIGLIRHLQSDLDAALAVYARGRLDDEPDRDRAGLADSLHVMGEAHAPGEPAAALLEEAVALWEDVGSPLGEATVRLAMAALPGDRDTRSVAVRVEEVARALEARALAAVAATLASRSRDSAPVAIRTLGGFAVLQDGEPVPRSGWQSRKARDLLKMMIARRGRMTARDVHMDALWPDTDPSVLSNRFSVALATVRSVLDPDKRFDSDHYVVAADDAVGLDLSHLDVDVERFLADADAGLALWRSGRASEAVERLTAAEVLYGGDFLEEHPYEDWTTQLREEVRMRYLAVAHTLAEAAADAGGPQAAVRYLLRILERDPYDERAHLSLVVNLQAAGHHGEARRSYRAYVARMEEIDVEAIPMPDARAPMPR